MSFFDGLIDFWNKLANKRNPQYTNAIEVQRLSDEELFQCYLTGLGQKIVTKKAGTALNDSIQFTSTEDEDYYNKKLDKAVKKAARWMMTYGRSIIVIFMPGEDLSQPLTADIDPDRIQIRVFSGKLVNVLEIERNLVNNRYFKPKIYHVRGVPIHYSRVVDFTYIEPDEDYAPYYRYGGISEFQIIYSQLINDSVIERASGRIIEINSNLFYKLKGFKSNIATKKEDEVLKYFSIMEDNRGIYGAGILDAEDEVITVEQRLTNLADVDQISLRRVAMVTGIPVSELVGENVRGLNSTGDNERTSFMEMIHTFQDDYLYEPANDLMRKLGKGQIQFKEAQGQTPTETIAHESRVIDNALKLEQIGEDSGKYLQDKKIIIPHNTLKSWEEEDAANL